MSRVPATVHLNQLTTLKMIDIKVIKAEVEQDEKLKNVMNKLSETEELEGKYSMKQGMLMYKGRMELSKTSRLIPTILHNYHDSVYGGHSGFLRTYKRVVAELHWKGMKHEVKKYCKECMICQRNKTLVLSPAGLLTPLEVLNRV